MTDGTTKQTTRPLPVARRAGVALLVLAIGDSILFGPALWKLWRTVADMPGGVDRTTEWFVLLVTISAVLAIPIRALIGIGIVRRACWQRRKVITGVLLGVFADAGLLLLGSWGGPSTNRSGLLFLAYYFVLVVAVSTVVAFFLARKQPENEQAS